MDTIRLCAECGAPLREGAPEGLCPKCVLKAGLTTEKDNSSRATIRVEPAPVPETIAKYFSQLEILELLGKGGMGTVYKARQPQLDRFVALKILSPELSRDPAFAERFSREARALAKLNHPNIVAIYDFGKAGDFYFFIMEYVDGMNLRQLEQAQKRLQPEEAFTLIPKICEALQYAHDEGVVHRDIKPGNILISKKGRVKIADFGLARIAGRESQDVRLTGSRDVMGTMHYMAPEQLENPQAVDHRADIYSVGVVFYEMLTGELPIGRFASPSRKVQVDVRLDEIVLRALEKEPDRRYQHASEVKTDVETIAATMERLAARLRGTADKAFNATVPPKNDTKSKQRAWAWTGAVVLAAVIIGGMLVHNRRTSPPPSSLEAGLRAHYGLDGDAEDSSGNRNQGTAFNVTWGPDRLNRPAHAAVFNKNGRIVVPHSATLRFGSNLTVAAWIKTKDEWGAIVDQHNGGEDGNFCLGVYWTVLRFGRSGNVLSSKAVNDDQWHHVAGVYDSSNQRVVQYIDGQIAGSWTEAKPLPQAAIPLTIGDENRHTWPYSGSIDEVRIYDRALSPAEISQLALE